MKRFCSALLKSVLVLAIGFTAVNAYGAPGLGSGTDTLVKGNTAFAFRLFQQLKERTGNQFFSPISISSAVAMALAGARGQTATEISGVLGYGPPSKALHASVQKLVAQLLVSGNDKGSQLSLANALWVARGHGLLPEYVSLLKSYYGAGAQELDFANNSEGSRQTINAWIEKKTSGHIKDLLAPGSLGAVSRLVLTNAIYFKGTWESTFKTKYTSPAPFTVSPGKTVTVSMMNQTAFFNYAEDNDFQAVELPYKGGALSMIVILPREKSGLARVEGSLNGETVEKLLAGLSSNRVDLYLPKFTLRSRINLGSALQALGMTGAFSAPPADFSGMNGKKNLHISEVLHEAFVDVSEKGTEAAAATATTFGATMSVSYKVFKVDHPFVFLVRDRQSNSVLFLGKVVDPGKRGN